jgi:hypothetical protein
VDISALVAGRAARSHGLCTEASVIVTSTGSISRATDGVHLYNVAGAR